MADEAAVVGVGKGFWAAACSRCDWIYKGQCREVDSAARSHCQVCGGDVVAMTNPGKEVVLRLERDVRGKVIQGSPTTLLSDEPELVIEDAQDALAAYGRRITQPGYWKVSGVDGNRSGFEDD